ncbi:glycosyl transferase family 10 (putative fucosyltransferase) [Mesorhizobium loti]|uniref:Glycosyl transferase family 10 (Putative fucosyltransferase) n=1 Tax=Rhizobium loti TaxID=381 RepID=A0A8E3B1L8_RHILI|nr:glycosyl transferase family 10 (putative fucosyltransferase) [Mesorhizobium loti]
MCSAKLLTERPAPIVAACLDSWGGLDDAIHHLTPKGSGIWNNVAFVRKTSFTPDWHIIFNSPSVFGLPVDIEASPNRTIFAIGEPPTKAHRALHLGQGENTIVLTSDAELVARQNAGRRFVLSPPITRSWSVRKTYDQLLVSEVVDKPHRLSWITSNIALLKGHRYRLAFLERLREEIEFDLFGRGFQLIGDKWDALAPYRYSIAFENTRADYYFTEKLMDCFVAETMPIYYGSPAITRFFPPDSMVLIDPEDKNVGPKIREIINSDLWMERRDAIREAKRLVLEKYNIFAYLAGFIESVQDKPLPPKVMHIGTPEVDFGVDE